VLGRQRIVAGARLADKRVEDLVIDEHGQNVSTVATPVDTSPFHTTKIDWASSEKTGLHSTVTNTEIPFPLADRPRAGS